MLDLENSAQGVHGDTVVTADVSIAGMVTLVIENHVATVQLALSSLTVLSELERFMRTANSSELGECEIQAATGVVIICSRQDSRVIFSFKGDAALGKARHQIDIHLYGPRLREFLDCLSDVHEKLMAD